MTPPSSAPQPAAQTPAARQIDHPDPEAIADFAQSLLRIEMTPWQRDGLTNAVISYGFALLAFNAPQPAGWQAQATAVTQQSALRSETPIHAQMSEPKTVTTDLRGKS